MTHQSDPQAMRAASQGAGHERPTPASLPSPVGQHAITLTLPWVVLVPDNAKYGVSGGRIVLASRYRHAKQAITELAMCTMRGAPPFVVPVSLVAMVHEPNRSRTRDVANFCKLVHDGLSGEVYDDDVLLHDVRWIRGPIDPDNPRVEIAIAPL